MHFRRSNSLSAGEQLVDPFIRAFFARFFAGALDGVGGVAREGPFLATNLNRVVLRPVRGDAERDQIVPGIAEPLLLDTRDIGER